MSCPVAVPAHVMHHVVRVESSFNPYAIGVVGGRLLRQPKTLAEALATVRMLEERGYNFSVGLAQVNRHNLAKYGLDSYEKAFQQCPNLLAGSRILAECHGRSGGDWGKSFSCYYSGNFVTGFRHGYVQKVYASMQRAANAWQATAAQPAPSLAVTPAAAHAPLVQASTSQRLIDQRIVQPLQAMSAPEAVQGGQPVVASVPPSVQAPVAVQPVPAPAGMAIAYPVGMGAPSRSARAASHPSGARQALAAPEAAVDQAFVF